MSQRKNIRHAIANQLRTLATLHTRVHTSRMYPVNLDVPATLPCVLVYTDRDPASKVNDTTQRRDLAIRIVVIVRADDSADDLLDDLCGQIEDRLDLVMNGSLQPELDLPTLVDACTYVDTALNYAGEEGRADYVHAEMTYALSYYRTPPQQHDALNIVHTDIDLSTQQHDPTLPNGPDGQIDAGVTIFLNIDKT